MADRRTGKKKVVGTERRTKRRHDDGSSSEAQGLDLPFGYLFEHDIAAHENFLKFFVSRKICEPKSLDSAFFRLEGFDIVPLLHQTHLLVLAEMKCPYSEVMVRAFYQNLHYAQGELTSRVCGIDIVMTAPIWTELLGFDFDESGDAVMYDGDSHHIFGSFDRLAIVAETRRADAEAGHFAHYPVSNLSVPARILHYVVTHIIFQRGHNHSKVLEGDFVVLWAILHHIQVNWRHYICILMWKASKSRKAELPFAFLVQKILHRFGVPMETETLKTAEGWNFVFGERLLKQCGITQSRGGVWYWKKAPEPPEVPLHHDAVMEDAPAGIDDDDDDDDDVPEAEDRQ